MAPQGGSREQAGDRPPQPRIKRPFFERSVSGPHHLSIGVGKQEPAEGLPLGSPH